MQLVGIVIKFYQHDSQKKLNVCFMTRCVGFGSLYTTLLSILLIKLPSTRYELIIQS